VNIALTILNQESACWWHTDWLKAQKRLVTLWYGVHLYIFWIQIFLRSASYGKKMKYRSAGMSFQIWRQRYLSLILRALYVYVEVMNRTQFVYDDFYFVVEPLDTTLRKVTEIIIMNQSGFHWRMWA
jgi:hypothetical protein